MTRPAGGYVRTEHRVAACLARVVHNVVAHPLLVLCPPVGEFLHDLTAPPPEEITDA